MRTRRHGSSATRRLVVPLLGMIFGVSHGAADDVTPIGRRAPSGIVIAQIVGADRTPLRASASVNRRGARDDGRPLTVATDARGGLHLTGLTAGAYRAVLTGPAGARRSIAFDVPPHDRPLDLGVVPVGSSSLSGRVVAGDDDPVPGARVRVLANERWATEATTDREGVFRIGGLPDGPYGVSVTRGSATASARLTTGVEGAVLTLEETGAIDGIVLRSDGTVPDKCQVAALDPRSGRSRRAAVGPDGRFTLRTVPAGAYRLEVETMGRSAVAVADVAIEAGATTSITLSLPSGGAIRGTVVDEEGALVGGARLEIEAEPSGASMATTTSDASGRFEVLDVPAGRAFVSASRPGLAPGRSDAFEVTSEASIETSVVLPAGGTLEGTVHGRDAALRGLSMRVSTVPVTTEPMIASVAGDGGYALRHVPAGAARLCLLDAAGHVLQQRDVTVTAGEVVRTDFTRADIAVRGRLTRWGRAVGGMTVTLESSAATAGPATTGDDGSFDLTVDQPGDFVAYVADARGRTALPPRRVRVEDRDEQLLLLEIDTARVSGRVRGPGGRAVAGAHVAAFSSDGSSLPAASRSDPDGAFDLGLPPGRYRVAVDAPRLLPASLELTVSQLGVSDLEVTLARGMAIEGRVIDARGAAVPGASVTALAASGGVQVAETGTDGVFRLTSLHSEPQTLLAMSGQAGFAQLPAVMPGREEIVLRLRPGARLRLRVRGEGAAPQGAWASVTGVDGVPVRGTRPYASDPGGLIDMPTPAGHLELKVWSRTAAVSTFVEVGPGEVREAESTLGP